MDDQSNYQPIEDGEVQAKRTPPPPDKRPQSKKSEPAPESFSRASHYS